MLRLNANSGEVEVLNDSGAVHRLRKPLGVGASAVLQVGELNDAVVLLDPDAYMRGAAFSTSTQ
jgi:hypothetical protein